MYKIHPNWDFWFENEPSGNPARHNMLIANVRRAELVVDAFFPESYF
jgi:hypothetical protein